MILVTVGINVNNLGYLEERSLCFIELSNGGTEELNKILVGIYIAAVIPENDNQNPLDPINSKAKQVDKKKRKAKRCQQRKLI